MPRIGGKYPDKKTKSKPIRKSAVSSKKPIRKSAVSPKKKK